jgi:hypothetical protein
VIWSRNFGCGFFMLLRGAFFLLKDRETLRCVCPHIQEMNTRITLNVILSAAGPFAREWSGGIEGPLNGFAPHNRPREFSHASDVSGSNNSFKRFRTSSGAGSFDSGMRPRSR